MIWERVSAEELERQAAERCTATRGPRSKVRCEVPMPIHDRTGVHMGRGPSGRWFLWDVTEEEARSYLRTAGAAPNSPNGKKEEQS